MPGVGDLVKITSCSNVLGQQACNVFYYVVAAWTGNLSLEEALEAWDTIVNGGLNGLMPSTVDAGSVEWRSVDNPAEVVSVPGGLNGNEIDVLVATFGAYSVRMYGATGVTRSGWKRIPGVTEVRVDSGVVTAATIAALQTWADDVLVGTLVIPGTGTVEAPDVALSNVIVGRNPDGTLNITAVNPVVSATPQPRMTTQNTRKVGRGS